MKGDGVMIGGKAGTDISIAQSSACDRHIEAVAWWMAELPSVGLSCCIVRDGAPVFMAAAGKLALGEAPPVTAATLFPLASLTKSFTASLAARLVADGVLDWDRPVIDDLPWLRFHADIPARLVTLRDLLGHRVGFDRVALLEFCGDFSSDELIDRLRFVPPVAPFRTRKCYSNIAYLLAGRVMAEATGRSWSSLIRERLLNPLGMNDTSPDFIREDRADLVSVHGLIGGSLQRIERWDRTSHAPASTVHSNATDMAKWLMAHVEAARAGDHPVLGPRSGELHSPQVVADRSSAVRQAKHAHASIATSGLGWDVEDRRGTRISWHDGSVMGVSSMMLVVPEHRLSVFVVQNTPFQARTWALANEFADHEIGWTPHDWRAPARIIYDVDDAPAPPIPKADAVSAPQGLEALAGTYEHEAFGHIEVTSTATGLAVALGRAAAYNQELVHAGGDRFIQRYIDASFDYGNEAMVTLDIGRSIADRVFPVEDVGVFRRV